MLAVEAEGLAKRYAGLLGRGGHEALRGLDLRVPAGAAFGLIGPNGAGKTTFVKALLGVVRPSAGTVRLLGGDPQDPRVRARVGYLPERLRLPSAWTPLETLESVARLKRAARDRARLLALLEEVGIAKEASRRVGTFSKGMRQRVGLAAALVGEPELLVLDEPTDGLDPIARADVRGLLGRLLARGATVFLNSHLLSETERICGRVGVLVAGRIVREGPLEELLRASPRWRVRFSDGAPAEALAAAGFRAQEGGAFAHDAADPAALNAALDAARAAGALVVEVGREQRELEQVLADAMEAA
ncbi:MAG TPA: ABC transporter ATP-binding protein [Anaeromyxobacteraceae bacterium]|nr:ABC transporter ATP-binding protein [Anaeromyxobacteraceae bacterium]